MKLNQLSDKDLSDLRNKILSHVPEASLLNKDLEIELLLELFKRTSSVDNDLWVRTIYSADDIDAFSPLFSLNCEFLERRLSPGNLRHKILLLGSKFGDFVSSQEFVYGVLDSLDRDIDVLLASKTKISPKYQSRFETFEEINAKKFLEIVGSEGIHGVVDLTGNNKELIRLISGEIAVLNPWGSMLPGEMANVSIAWPEMAKYRRHWRGQLLQAERTQMFLPPESTLRHFPTIERDANNQTLRFGAFCRTSKLSLKVLTQWSLALKRHPDSTLSFAFIQSNPKSEAFIKGLFSKLGVNSNRISFLPRLGTQDYLGHLNSIHINLGAMPEQGGISCMDSLVMGCPYIVCDDLSNTYTSSLILSELGLDSWRARSIDDYHQVLEQEIERISETSSPTYRTFIRGKLLNSVLSDAKRTAGVWSNFFRLARERLC